MAMLEPEVNPVIMALRKHSLQVVALHQHMIGEDPRIIFLHYYGTGPATALASGFRAALDELGRHGRAMEKVRGMRQERRTRHETRMRGTEPQEEEWFNSDPARGRP